MSDQPDKPEDGDTAPGEAATPEPELLRADDVRLSDPDVSADSVEPTLNTSAEELRLSEPSLEGAEISDDAAEAASLEEAAAEAESVAQEAENVGTLVAGPRPADDPAEVAAPSGTAPAGGPAGDTVSGNTAEDTTDIPGSASAASMNVPGPEEDAAGASADQEAEADPKAAGDEKASGDEREDAGSASSPASRDEPDVAAAAENTAQEDSASEDKAPDAPWTQPFPHPHPQAPGSPVPPVGGPYGLPPANPDAPAPTRIRARAAGRSSKGSKRKMLIIVGIVGVLVIALLIFAITGIVNAVGSGDSAAGSSPNTTPGADGIIAENISPMELGAGACILGFDSANVSADVTTVSCTTPHNAQLLATTSFPEDSDFPGEAALTASGDDLCNSAPIDEDAAADYTGLTLTQVTPTSGTWADGDRRIDCFVVSDEGNVITDTLLAE